MDTKDRSQTNSSVEESSLDKLASSLDTCAEKANEAKQTGDWESAYVEADKLRSLLNLADVAQTSAHLVEVVCGIAGQNWLLVLVGSTTTICLLLGIWLRIRAKK